MRHFGGYMELKQAIASLFIFDGCDFSRLDAEYGIMNSVTVSEYADGDCITDERTPGLPVILSGSAVIYTSGRKKETVLRRVGTGDSFGAATLFQEGSEKKTAVRASGHCTVALLPMNVLLSLLEDGTCSMNYIRFLSRRIDFLNKKIAAFTAGGAEERLAVYLASLPCDNDGICNIPVSLSELSSMLSLGRASLYRAFDVFSEEGMIKKDGKKVTLLSPDKLKKFIK